MQKVALLAAVASCMMASTVLLYTLYTVFYKKKKSQGSVIKRGNQH